MMLWQAALGAGAMVGGGVALVVHQVVGAPPDLRAAVARLSGTDAPAPVPDAALKVRVGQAVAARTDVPRLPGAASPADLVLVGTDPSEHLGDKVLGALVGLVGPAAVAAVLALAGLRVPAGVVVVVTVLMVLAGWAGPDLTVSRRAA
ncbi:MAG: hypothetical protein LBU50_07110, partial [Cellulomonas sp.]|nr:hypothetical protein [Cellulomonas sp.]